MRGRSSSPISVAKVCSAGPPEARRRRIVSVSAPVPGIRSPSALLTTCSTQPSISASKVSSRVSAACCSGVVLGSNDADELINSSSFDGLANNSVGSRSVVSCSMPLKSMLMPRAYSSTVDSRRCRSHGTWANSRTAAASRAARNTMTSWAGCSRPPVSVAMASGSSTATRRGQRQADVGAAEHFLGQLPEPLSELGAERHTAHLGQHSHHRTGELRGLGGQIALPRLGQRGGHRIAETLPRGHRLLQPLHGCPGDRLGDAAGKTVASSSHLGQPDRILGGLRLAGADRGELTDLLPCQVVCQLIVHRPRRPASGQTRTHSAEQAAELREHLAQRRGLNPDGSSLEDRNQWDRTRRIETLGTAETETERILAAGTAAGAAVLPPVPLLSPESRRSSSSPGRETEGQVSHVFNGTVRAPGIPARGVRRERIDSPK